MTFEAFDHAIEGFGDHRGLSVQRIASYLDQGGDINAQSSKGDMRGLLHFAAEDMNSEVIRLLIQRGVDLELRMRSGWTALHLAVDADVDCATNSGQKITLGTVKTLIEVGANELAQNDDGGMPRDIAVSYLVHDLYDSVSRIDWSAEPSIIDFTERCIGVIHACGLDARVLQGVQISVARQSSDHSSPWKRFYIFASHWYGKRHCIDFDERLSRVIIEGIKNMEARL